MRTKKRRYKRKYIGYLEKIEDLNLKGWVYNKENLDEKVKIAVLIDGKPVLESIADTFRENLYELEIGDGKYGFDIELPEEYADGKEHEIRVVVKRTGKDVEGSPRKIILQPSGDYIGNLEGIEGLVVKGWAYNKANSEERVEVVVYVNGKPVAAGVADKYREDLKQAGIGDGKHAFEIKIPDEYVDDKEHEISVVVKNKLIEKYVAKFIDLNYKEPINYSCINFQLQDDAVIIPFEFQWKIRECENRINFFSNNIKSYVEKNSIKVLSFDVFDTVLLRENKCEIERFFEWAEECSKTYSLFKKDDLFLYRLKLHKDTYIHSEKGPDGTIEGNIVNMLIICLQLSNCKAIEKCIDNLINCEIEYEINHTVINPVVIELIKYMKEKIKIIFQTDTYLPKDIVGSILYKKFKSVGLNIDNIKIYSSASLRQSKRCGGMYDFVLKDLNLKPYEMLHIGDNLFSDYIIPKRKNIHTFFMPISENEIYQRLKSFYRMIELYKGKLPSYFSKEYLEYFNL